MAIMVAVVVVAMVVMCVQGHAWMTAHVEKDSYFPGEVANVLLQVRGAGHTPRS